MDIGSIWVFKSVVFGCGYGVIFGCVGMGSDFDTALDFGVDMEMWLDFGVGLELDLGVDIGSVKGLTGLESVLSA